MRDNNPGQDQQNIDNYLRNKMDDDEELEVEYLGYSVLFEEVENTDRLIEGLKELDRQEPHKGVITLQKIDLIATLMESNFCKWLAFEKCQFDASKLQEALYQSSMVESAALSSAAEYLALKTMNYFRDAQTVVGRHE